MKKILSVLLVLAALLAMATSAALAAEIALVTDVGTIDDESFNQACWEGVKAYAEANGKTYQYYQPGADSTDERLNSIDLAVSEGAKVVVCPGYLFGETVAQAQELYPDVDFIAVDVSAGDLGGVDAQQNLYCAVLKPLMTESIVLVETNNAISANKPACTPKFSAATTTTIPSMVKSTIGTVNMLRCAWTIIAAMSVPPVVAPARTTMPSPAPIVTPPKMEASIMFPARSNSGIRSMNSDSSSIEMNERTAKRTPTRRQPMANSGTLIKKLSRPTFSPVTLESTVAMPVTPPGAMSLVTKNAANANAVSSAPTVSSR